MENSLLGSWEICEGIRAKVKAAIKDAPAANPLRIDLMELDCDLRFFGLYLQGLVEKDELLEKLTCNA